MSWLYSADIRTAIIDGWLTVVLVDSGAHMNVVTPEFVKARGLVAGSIQDLNNHAGAFRLTEREGSVPSPWST